MNPVALAILGLFFWQWSHQTQHGYEKQPRTWLLVLWALTSILSFVLLVDAGVTAWLSR